MKFLRSSFLHRFTGGFVMAAGAILLFRPAEVAAAVLLG